MKYPLKNIRPAANQIGDDIANILAYILAPAIASEDPAKKVTNSAYDATNCAADSVNYILADILQDRGKHIDDLLDKLTDLNQHPFDYSYDDLDQLNNRLKYQLANKSHLDVTSYANIV